MKKLLMIFTIFILIFTCAHAEDEFLSVVDTAGMISAPEEKYILTMNKVLSETTGARIVVATAESTGELSVVEYAASLYDELGVGRIGRKNCVFLFLCEGAEDYHVIVSNGISASLTNDYAQKILVEYMEKDFAKGNYDDAVLRTFNAFGEWFSRKYGTDIPLTEDMSEYKNIIRTETNERTLKIALIIFIAVTVVGGILWFFAYRRREKRMEKLRKKRQERRKRYMQIK